METKHTPGPWVTGNTSPLIFGVKRGNGTEPIGFVYGPSFTEKSKYGQTAMANARLIAAAPEMYEVIAAIATAMNLGYIPNEILSEGSPILEELRAAIAKAEGK